MDTFVIGLSQLVIDIRILPRKKEKKRAEEEGFEEGVQIILKGPHTELLKECPIHSIQLSGPCYIPIKLLNEKGVPSKFLGAVGSDRAEIIKEKFFIAKIPFALELRRDVENYKRYIFSMNRSVYAPIVIDDFFFVTESFIDKNLQTINNAKIIMYSNYSVMYSSDISEYLLNKLSHNVLLALHLENEKLVDQENICLHKFYKRANIIFGNHKEIKELYYLLHKTTSDNIEQLVKRLSSNNKMVFCTNGPNPVICAENENLHIHKIEEIKSTEIDTFGAGDAFIAGVFYGMYKEKDFDGCINEGVNTARDWILSKPKDVEEVSDMSMYN
ncbi:pfkB family carbohydrate kinase [Spraguea lophii 42_110]|uniref:Adenosine kinase n=1 Tax=Spraguea lophii (strain 42_110) TaxID=1358809 RepID=S7W4K9_SPRLO|nr:pfkB family carbohydrate kinase [Spraguea lophii 42_110]